MQKFSEIKSASDLDLVNQYKATNDNSFVGHLFQRYTHLVFGVCMKYFKDEDDSKDAVMQIFEKLLVDLKKHQVENFKYWLHAVAKNHCLMKLRSNQAKFRQHEEMRKDVIGFMEKDYDSHPGTVNPLEEKLQSLEEAISTLGEEQKLCIELFYIKEMSYQEVSDNTGFSLNQVKSYIQNGKRNLKLILENKREFLTLFLLIDCALYTPILAGLQLNFGSLN